jgi:phosphatidate cytidylyltransferase
VKERLIAALVGLAVLLPAVIFGGVLAVDVIVVLAGAVCVAEYAAMAFPDDRWVKGAFVGGGALAVHAVALYVGTWAWGGALLGVVLAAFVFVTFRPGASLEPAADHVGRLVLGVGWFTMLTTLCLLRRLDHGLAWCFLVLAVSWLGDTGGYFAGKYLGRNPLYPKVSPKKTWEGAVGGVILSTVGTWVVGRVGLPELSLVEVLVGGPVLCVGGIVGDLSESLLKRSFGVKDSGWIMPGHGGLLDRIDSVLFVAPLVLALATWGPA